MVPGSCHKISTDRKADVAAILFFSKPQIFSAVIQKFKKHFYSTTFHTDSFSEDAVKDWKTVLPPNDSKEFIASS